MGFSTIGRTDATLPPTRCREAYFDNLPSTNVWQQVVSVLGEGVLYGLIVNRHTSVELRVAIDGAASSMTPDGLVGISNLGGYFALPIKFASQLIVEARATVGSRGVLVRYGTI